MYSYQINYPIFRNSDTAPETWKDRFRRVDASQNSECLSEYSDDYLAHPEFYFVVDGNYLKCLGVRGEIPCRTGDGPVCSIVPEKMRRAIKKRYPKLLTSERDMEYPLLDGVYFTLRDKKFTPYYKTLMEFKWETGLLAFPLFDLQEYIQVRNGKLWGLVEYMGQMCWSLLTDEVVSREIKRHGGRTCSDDGLKMKLAKELLKLHSEQNTQDEDQGQIDVTTPHFHLSYSPLLNQAAVVRLNGFRFHIASPSSSLQNFLRTIAGGSRDRLDDFAELLARLYSPKLPSEYLWGIVGKADDISWFLQLLHNNLGLHGFCSGIFEKPSNKSLIHFLNSQGSKAAYQVNYTLGNSESFKTVNHSQIIRFISGEKIGTVDDPYIIDGEVTGKGVLIYAALELSEDCMDRIPHKIIQLPDNCKSSQLSGGDMVWLQTCLLCHGLHLLNMPETKSSNDAQSLDQALKKFVKSFCEIRANAWTDRKQLYEQFKRYCDSCINLEEKMLGSTKFSAYVEETLCWKSREVRSNKNRLAFDGIYVDEEKLESFIRDREKTNTAQVSTANSDDFDAYLDSFSNYLHLPGTMRTV